MPEDRSVVLVDGYLRGFAGGVASSDLALAFAAGYMLDDGTASWVASAAVRSRIDDLRSSMRQRHETLERWQLHPRGTSDSVALVEAELEWRTPTGVRRQVVSYLVRLQPVSDRIAAVVTDP